ncbi:hypothetical protein GOV07_03815 [Candidatus Woesearchaeota archaeon]|nr:hypothetical protein [Candidatus Woesearchaeota archaeon]
MKGRREDFCRDYQGSITLRIFLIFIIWIWYSITPYTIPIESLWILTGGMLLYAAWLYHIKHPTMGLLMLVAAGLNTLMIPYWSKQLNLLLALAITVILFWDIVTTNQKCGAE